METESLQENIFIVAVDILEGRFQMGGEHFPPSELNVSSFFLKTRKWLDEYSKH